VIGFLIMAAIGVWLAAILTLTVCKLGEWVLDRIAP